jgi:hypothetical protein
MPITLLIPFAVKALAVVSTGLKKTVPLDNAEDMLS